MSLSSTLLASVYLNDLYLKLITSKLNRTTRMQQANFANAQMHTLAVANVK